MSVARNVSEQINKYAVLFALFQEGHEHKMKV